MSIVLFKLLQDRLMRDCRNIKNRQDSLDLFLIDLKREKKRRKFKMHLKSLVSLLNPKK